MKKGQSPNFTVRGPLMMLVNLIENFFQIKINSKFKEYNFWNKPTKNIELKN